MGRSSPPPAPPRPGRKPAPTTPSRVRDRSCAHCRPACPGPAKSGRARHGSARIAPAASVSGRAARAAAGSLRHRPRPGRAGRNPRPRPRQSHAPCGWPRTWRARSRRDDRRRRARAARRWSRRAARVAIRDSPAMNAPRPAACAIRARACRRGCADSRCRPLLPPADARSCATSRPVRRARPSAESRQPRRRAPWPVPPPGSGDGCAN